MKELSTDEWHVMEGLWKNNPKVGNRVVADLRDSVGLSQPDEELAGDEGVLRQQAEKSRKRYGEALVKMLWMAARTAVLVSLLALGLAACTFSSRSDVHGEDPAADKAGVFDTEQKDNAETSDMGVAANVGVKTGFNNEMETVSPGQSEDSESGSGDKLWVDMALEKTGVVYDDWDAQTLAYYDEEGHPAAKVTEGDITRKLTFVETSWSVSAAEAQFSREVLYWACQALLELEQWTGTQVTEVCYAVSEFGYFSFSLTPEDMEHDRIFFSRCYNGLSFSQGEVIEHISYLTDMDVWYSPVKQYTTPPGYDRMTTQERLIWYFERSGIARDSKVEEVIYPWEGDDYLFRTDQGTYYSFSSVDGIDTVGRGMCLYGPYNGYPQH